MKIKKYADRKKELILLICAAALALIIIIYLFTLVRLLSKKASIVFRPPINVNAPTATFDFKRYDALVKKFLPADSSSSSTSSPSRSFP